MKKLGHILLFFLSFGVAFYAMAYWGFDKIALLMSKPDEVVSDMIFRFSFYGHVIFGPIALLTGPFQFMPNFRKKRMKLHRLLGKIYVVVCVLSGLAALSAAQYATGGIWNTVGFSTLAIFWLITTIIAYLKIRKKDITSHENWMLRSFALTFAAVTLRLQLGVFQGLMGMTFFEAYSYVAWTCWIPNLLIIEWWIWRKQKEEAVFST